MTPEEKEVNYPIGWICPRCNTVHAPFVRWCFCSSQPETKTTEPPCLWDSMPETSPGSGVKIGSLYCPCPKCTPRC